MKIPAVLLSLLLSLVLCEKAISGTSYARAGWVADLTTLAHNVSGRVTILDSSTLLVENFNYDGGGISVFFYLGATDDNTSFMNGVAVGPQLFGTPYSDGTLYLRVPGGVNLDSYGAISVWCVAAGVNFGSDSFTAPTTPRLILSALPGEVSAGQTLTFTHSEGAPSKPLLLFAVDVNGMPVFLNLLNGMQDASGEWCSSSTVPAGLSGFEVEFMTFGFVTPTKVGASNRVPVTFL